MSTRRDFLKTAAVGTAALINSVVEVPFKDLVPDRDRWWKSSSIERLTAPIGIFGARKQQLQGAGKAVA